MPKIRRIKRVKGCLGCIFYQQYFCSKVGAKKRIPQEIFIRGCAFRVKNKHRYF